MRQIKWLGFIFVLIFMAGFVSPDAHASNMGRKLNRGLTNIVTSPLELVVQPARVIKVDKEYALAPLSGLGKGFYFMLARLFSGVYELVTFPIPIPFHYESFFQPETVFDGLQAVREENWNYPPYGFGRMEMQDDIYRRHVARIPS